MGWGTKINIHFPFTFIKQLSKCVGEKERQKVGRSSLGHISQITCFCQQISKTNFIFLGSLPGTRSKSDKGSSKLQNEVQKPESSVEGLLGYGLPCCPEPLLGRLLPTWFSVVFWGQTPATSYCRPHPECCLHFTYMKACCGSVSELVICTTPIIARTTLYSFWTCFFLPLPPWCLSYHRVSSID